ncbi:hypothetical protein ACH4SP_12285 [Streptomyces sp. NPDC021093]|uniref:hypothetical protein n=1 Tax=Streptomyces sp. NPDC021093 TaxID=3365112 RepID=UPI0037AF04B5
MTRLMRTPRARRVTGLGAAAVLAATGLLVGGQPAAAGPNGQQIKFEDRQHIANSVYVKGHNQHGQVVGHCWNTPTATTHLAGWWWKGSVNVHQWSKQGCRGTEKPMLRAYIPVSQPSDWTTVHN